MPAHIGPLLLIAVIVGFGLMVIVNVVAVPLQVAPSIVTDGVAVTVAITGVEPLLVPANELIVPEPLAPRPIDVVLFVQPNVVPATAPEKPMVAMVPPSQVTLSDTPFTFGCGFTLCVYDVAVPEQPLATGVTVIVPDIWLVVVLVAVKAGIAPVPLAPRPIAVLELVQLYTVPPTNDPVGVTEAVSAPTQDTGAIAERLVTLGIGCTVAAVVAVALQLPPSPTVSV